MKFRRSQVGKKEGPRIEITPMIDVVFLLLIFLLISTQFKKQKHAFKVPLPRAGEVEILVQPNVPVLIVQSDGNFVFLDPELIGGEVKPVGADNLKRQLEVYTQNHQDVSLRIRGDKDSPFQSIINALDIAKKSGIANVLLEAEKREEGETP